MVLLVGGSQQETIDFELPEMLAREYIESHLGKLGLAVAELLEPRNIDVSN